MSTAIGPVVKADSAQRVVTFVVYSPHRRPARGADGRTDLVSKGVLERAAWRWMENGAKVGVDHRPGGEKAATVVESGIHRGKPWKVTCPDGTVEKVRTGDWLIALRLAPGAWGDYCAGRFGGVSMQGTARRKSPSSKTLGRVKER